MLLNFLLIELFQINSIIVWAAPLREVVGSDLLKGFRLWVILSNQKRVSILTTCHDLDHFAVMYVSAAFPC